MATNVTATVTFWYEATLRSYAQILFTNRLIMGGVGFLATLLEPSMALAGLYAVLVANVGARWLCFNRDTIRTGYYGFNGLLVGLALSYYYSLTVPLLVLITIGSLLTVLLTVGLTSSLSYYFQLPTLSLPFVLVTPVMYLAADAATALILEPKALKITGMMLSVEFPPLLETFFRALGSIYFMPNLVSGMLLFIGLLLVSRVLSIFAVIGYVTGVLLFVWIGVPHTMLMSGMFGFNLMLVAMVFGGVFIIPSPWSYALAIGAAICCAILGLALQTLFAALGLQVLTAPFILTTLLILYALKFREYGSGPQLVTFPPGTPEENLDFVATQIKRFGSYAAVRFSLPFHGVWKISQGVQGPYTHKGPWGYAWDFLVVNEEHSYRDAGQYVTDYYAYGLPVLAPADGTVVQVVDWVVDNEIGVMNTKDNWGNVIVLQHAPQVYSVLAHLLPQSSPHWVGAMVRRGEKVGLCGNSGRSLEPHLHFHVQDGPALVGRTICPAFTRFLEWTPDGRRAGIIQQALPESATCVSNVETGEFLAGALRFLIGQQLAFRVTTSAWTREERWLVGIDFAGTLFLETESGTARAWIWTGEGIFTVLSYTGRTDTALFAFTVGASLVPLTFDSEIHWKDTLPYRYFLRSLPRIMTDIVRPFYDLTAVRSQLGFLSWGKQTINARSRDVCSVGAEITVDSVLPRVSTRGWKTVVTLEQTLGPVFIRLESPRGWVLEAEAMVSD